MSILTKRIFNVLGAMLGLDCTWKDLKTNRIVRIVGVDEGEEVRGNSDWESRTSGAVESSLLLSGERENCPQLLNSCETIAQLPAPIIPFIGWDLTLLVGLGGEIVDAWCRGEWR